jgi:hypothetical protein
MVPELDFPVGQNRTMGLDIDFAIEVGEQEKHQVAFHWGQFFGRVRITVDEMQVVEKNKAFTLRTPRTRKFEFSVGQSETHDVVIEKTRKRVLGGARKQDCKVLVDGTVVGEY